MSCNCDTSPPAHVAPGAVLPAKFGTCPVCITATVTGLLVSGTTALFVWSQTVSPLLQLLATIPALVFFLWGMLHLLGYLLKKWSDRDAIST